MKSTNEPRKNLMIRLSAENFRKLDARREELGTTFQAIAERLLMNWVRSGGSLPPLPDYKGKGRNA